jgi:AcrR family transcriptional regulator
MAAAVEVFIAHGYRRAQIEDIAGQMGVAKGTVYLYVDGKQTLFDLAVRYADDPESFEAPADLPVRGLDAANTVAFVRERMSAEGELPVLARALENPRGPDARAELEAVIRELYTTLSSNRLGIKLIDSCARDHPELGAIFYAVARQGLPGRLEAYIRAGARQGRFRSFADPAVAARTVMETVTFWAVHRHWDPAPQVLEDASVEETVVTFVCGALLDE